MTDTTTTPAPKTRRRSPRSRVVEPSDGGPGSPGIDTYLGDNTPEPGPDPADDPITGLGAEWADHPGDRVAQAIEVTPDAAVLALAKLGQVPDLVEVLRARLDEQYAQIMAFEQLAGARTTYTRDDDDAVARAIGERDSAMVECDRLRTQLNSFLHAPFVPVGFVAGCEDCKASNVVERPDLHAMPGHHCTACRDGGGEWTPTPHGYDLCPSHLADLGGALAARQRDDAALSVGDEPVSYAAALVELRGIVERTGHPALRVALAHLDATDLVLAGDDDAMITDPGADDLADPNGEAGELSAEQIEALADKMIELLGKAGGWVSVQRRWADIELGAVFIGRKGDMWLVTQAPGRPGEFDKNKVTVKVYGISPSGNPAEFARSFDADEQARVLVPAVERDALAVLRDQLGGVDGVKLLGPVETDRAVEPAAGA